MKKPHYYHQGNGVSCTLVRRNQHLFKFSMTGARLLMTTMRLLSCFLMFKKLLRLCSPFQVCLLQLLHSLKVNKFLGLGATYWTEANMLL